MASSDQSAFTTRPPGNPADEAWSDLPLPLRECGEIAALRLSSALSDALVQAAEHLFKEATEALTHHEREALVDAADFARQHRNGMVFDFMKHFEHRYLRACRRKPNSLLGHDIDFDAKEMKIVEHHLLDDSLEPGKITEAIQHSSWKTLQMLTSHFRDLLDCQDLMPNDLPLGPRVIEAAVSDALRDQPWRHKAKHRLANALRWGLAARVNLLYRDLVDLLSARDLKSLSEPGHEVAPVAAESDLPADRPMEQVPAAAEQTTPAQGMEAMVQAQTSATEAAQREVTRCLGTSRLPLVIEEFLSRHWWGHLARLHTNLGADSPGWRDAVRTMDDLAWSLSPKNSQEDFARLKEGLPNLLKRLNQGMDALALPPASRDHFMVLLVKHLGEVVQRYEARAPLAQAAPSPVQTPKPAMPAQLPESAMAPPPPAQETEPPAAEREHAPCLADLKVGTWMEFQEPDGQTRELKLAWISPHRNLYLLTDRAGARALYLKAENLALRLQDGHARITQSAHVPPSSQGITPVNASKKTA